MGKLIGLLEAQIQESEEYSSDVSEQRERNHRYYNMEPFGNEKRGRSHYIDPAVFSSVEDKKAVFAETFLGSRQVAKFSGTNYHESLAKSAYAQRILKANNYQRLLKDFWHDSFVAKKGNIWLSWRRAREQVSITLNGAPTPYINQQLQQLGQVIDIDDTNLQQTPIPSIGPPQFIYTGELVATVDKSHISLDLVQPEFFSRDPTQTYADDAMWNTARIDTSKSALIDMGFNRDDVSTLNLEYRWGTSEEDYARKSYDNSGGNTTEGAGRHGEQAMVTVYKTRTWLTPEDLEEFDGFQPESDSAIYEVCWGHGKVLKWDDGTWAIHPLETMDVYEWVELKVSHAEGGMCTADVEVHQQKAESQLKRGIIDNMNITNNPRWLANLGALNNPRDLLDNVIGGVIDSENPNAVMPLPQPKLSPMVMSVLEMMSQDSQERSGYSDLASGMNQGAVNNQNADSLIERLTTAGARRVGMAVRDFANTCYVPLLQGIVRLGRLMDKSQDVMEAGGEQIPIIPAQWQDDDDMEIEVALTPEEAQVMAGRLMQMNQMISADEDMKPLYRVEQKHRLYDTVYELMGVKDATPFLDTPNSPQYQQYQQQAQQEAQMAQQQAMEQIEFQKNAILDNSRREWTRLDNTIMDTVEDNELNERKHDLDEFKVLGELKLEEEQERAVSIS